MLRKTTISIINATGVVLPKVGLTCMIIAYLEKYHILLPPRTFFMYDTYSSVLTEEKSVDCQGS